MTGAAPRRCAWVGDDEVMVAYHDDEWGVPLHEEKALFESLTLEGAQAGLSWSTILKKREGYRRAFAGFEPAKVARFNVRSVERLMNDAGIVRNRLKIESTIANARAFLGVQEEHGSFDAYIWDFVDGAPRVNRFRRLADLPARTETSDRMSRELRSLGFRFVGPTICYAFMQAAGLVNDHETGCFRHRELQRGS